MKSRSSDSDQAGWDGDAGQTGAAIESKIPNVGHTFWDGDAGQGGAALECPIQNPGYIGWDIIMAFYCVWKATE